MLFVRLTDVRRRRRLLLRRKWSVDWGSLDLGPVDSVGEFNTTVTHLGIAQEQAAGYFHGASV